MHFKNQDTKKVKESIFKKYFKMFLVSKSSYLKLQGSYRRHLSFSLVSGETRITETKCDISFD